MDARAGHWASALDRAEVALGAQPGDSRARGLRAVALRALGRGDEAEAALSTWLSDDPLDQFGLALARRPASGDPRTLLDVAREMAAAGDTDRALSLLDEILATPPGPLGDPRPIAQYERAAICERMGRSDAARAARTAAQLIEAHRCFPHGLDDHDTLVAAVVADPEDLRAASLLALLLFGHGRAEEALSLWIEVFERGLTDPVAFRTAAIAAYNVRGDAAQALDWYARALELDPCARLLFERDQLSARVGTSERARLVPLDLLRAEVLTRDDLTVTYCRLLVRARRGDEALAILESRRFAPWEGGEGQSIAVWEEVLSVLSDEARNRGDLEHAAVLARRAIEIPENLSEQRHPLSDTTELHERLAGVLDALSRSDEAAQVRAAAVRNAAGPIRALGEDGEVDYFATSLPDQLLFVRGEAVDRRFAD